MPLIPNDLVIQVPIDVPEVKHDDGSSTPSYRDVLFIPAGEFVAMTWDDIEKLKDVRYGNWLTAINTPPPAPDPVAPDDALTQARDALTQASAAVDAAIAAQESPADVGV